MSDITLFPADTERPEQIQGFIQNGEIFFIGDRVMLKHRPSGSRLFGILGGTYGVGRIRGFYVRDTGFTRETGYPMGQPGDEIYSLTVVERGEIALAAGKAHYEAHVKVHGITETAWEAYPPSVQEGYLIAMAQRAAHV